jgi:hypothetical protein
VAQRKIGLHPAQRVDLPQTLPDLVIPKSPHGAQRPVYRRLGAKTGAVGDLTCDQIGINLFDPYSRTPPPQPPSLPDQTSLGGSHGPLADPSSSVLLNR